MRFEVFTHRIDSEDRIIYLDRRWLAFAVKNSAPELSEGAVMGKSLWDFISDKETRHIYRLILDMARRTSHVMTVPFRCDSPERIRVMEMLIIPLPDGEVQFDSYLLEEKVRERVGLLDPAGQKSDKYLTICSWCKKIKLPDNGWVEAEEAVRELGLFGPGPLPNLTHGVCQPCNEAVFKKNRPGRRGG